MLGDLKMMNTTIRLEAIAIKRWNRSNNARLQEEPAPAPVNPSHFDPVLFTPMIPLQKVAALQLG